MKTLVLGLGNDLYGDDGVGLHVVSLLKEKTAGNSALLDEVDFSACTLTGLALLDIIVGYDYLIIIDTIKRNSPVTGRLHVLDASEIRHIPGPSPHYVSIPQMIEIGRDLGLPVPSRIHLIAVEAKDMYRLGEGLTEEMKKAVPLIMEKALRAIEERNKDE